MAAAYAALGSITQTIARIRQYNSCRPILSDKETIHHIESLHEAVSFLQGFLEGYDYGRAEETEGLESRIPNAAYVAEDIIDSYVVDDILAQFPEELLKEEYDGKTNYSQSLENAIEDMNFIRKEARIVMEKSKLKDQHLIDDVNAASSLRPLQTGRGTMAKFDDEFLLMMENLTGQPKSNLHAIRITGMGGIGKTTLANSIYNNQVIMEHFDIRAYFTISQEYNVLEMLQSLLRDIRIDGQSSDYHELGLRLHKVLTGRRYLIILDDMWSINAWDELKRFLPDNSNGSRIMVTTRLSYVANRIGSAHEMNLLNEKKSWKLLCKKVVGEKDCPPELEEIGKKIAKMCKGLPLSIALMGGLLAKPKMTSNDWEYYAENTNKTLYSAEDEYSSRIMSLSYNHLPIHLKPCTWEFIPKTIRFASPNLSNYGSPRDFLNQSNPKP